MTCWKHRSSGSGNECRCWSNRSMAVGVVGGIGSGSLLENLNLRSRHLGISWLDVGCRRDIGFGFGSKSRSLT